MRILQLRGVYAVSRKQLANGYSFRGKLDGQRPKPSKFWFAVSGSPETGVTTLIGLIV